MKQILFLIAIYALIINQRNKDTKAKIFSDKKKSENERLLNRVQANYKPAEKKDKGNAGFNDSYTALSTVNKGNNPDF